MTVVDEEQQIVFVKTHKTAGSSIELALSLALGKEAIVTLIMEDADRDVLRMRGCAIGRHVSGRCRPG